MLGNTIKSVVCVMALTFLAGCADDPKTMDVVNGGESAFVAPSQVPSVQQNTNQQDYQDQLPVEPTIVDQGNDPSVPELTR